MNVSKSERQITGFHVLIGMVCFFGVIISVNITMAVIASKSWTGLVVKNSYVASQQYNEKIEAAKIQNAAGVNSKFGYENGVLSVSLLDRTGKPLLTDVVSVEIGRPAFEQQDQTLEMKHVGNGSYVADVRLGTGLWQAEVLASLTDHTYRRDVRLFVNEAGEGLLQ